jgi:hypothetical protein
MTRALKLGLDAAGTLGHRAVTFYLPARTSSAVGAHGARQIGIDGSFRRVRRGRSCGAGDERNQTRNSVDVIDISCTIHPSCPNEALL